MGRRIVVYTMGKVGSVSLVHTLGKNGIYADHLHYGYLKNGEFSSSSHLKIGKAIRENLEGWTIISLLRRPLQRNMSAFFHSIGKYYDKDYYEYDLLKNRFTNVYDHGWSDRWLKEDLLPMTGFDYRDHFTRSFRWSTYKNSATGLQIVFIKLEHINDVLVPALESVDIKLATYPAFLKANKNTSNWYIRFRQQLSLSEEFFNRLHNTEYAKYAYAEADLALDVGKFLIDTDYAPCYPW